MSFNLLSKDGISKGLTIKTGSSSIELLGSSSNSPKDDFECCCGGCDACHWYIWEAGSDGSNRVVYHQGNIDNNILVDIPCKTPIRNFRYPGYMRLSVTCKNSGTFSYAYNTPQGDCFPEGAKNPPTWHTIDSWVTQSGRVITPGLGSEWEDPGGGYDGASIYYYCHATGWNNPCCTTPLGECPGCRTRQT